ncbi:MAG: UDP-N-acetylmuramoyl-L-alanyl-D-glutamate--2,6-diaminopimelate ligase, partial [Lachnospiraceae bacterium]|nr:UDP-N-acetylmuramoyl-L-alanyl-D-glutamate--2,6-diaminopimelate ligase [Lachnospiraceae bacterium]
MQIRNLLEHLEYTLLAGSIDTEITTLVYDSRKVIKGSVFVCISGTVRDTHDFIPDVVEKGASVLIVEKDVELLEGITYIKVENSRKALAYLSAAYFDYPATKIKTIGITGTKGKTTTTYLVKSILESAGIKTGLIGTIESIIGEKHIPSVNTTPESYVVQEMFAEMVNAGLEAVVMEVSSQALMLHRVAGFTFDIGVFTNLEPDHIGTHEHKDFEDYMHCKSLLFQQCKLGIFNGDSEHIEGIMKNHTCKVETFGYGENNDLRAVNVELLKEQGALGVKYHAKGLVDYEVEVNVPGSFSVYNSLTAIAICHHFQVEEAQIKSALRNVSVKGRI